MKQLFLALFVLLLGLPLGAQSCFSMYISTETATPGETICLDVKAEGADNLLGLQYTMKWDTAALRFSYLENFNLPGLGASSFNTEPGAVEDGRLSVAWFDATLSGVDVSAGQVVYSICFEALSAPAGMQPVYFDGTPTPVEFITANAELITNYALINGGAYTGSGSAPAITGACIVAPGCQGGGSANISIAGGQPLYTFDWQKDGITASTSQNLTAAGPGQYSLQATDAQGLVASGTFVLQGPAIEASYSHECSGSAGNYTANVTCTVTSGGAAPYTFSWSTGQVDTHPQLSTLSGVPGIGSYAVTITDAAGCEQTMDTLWIDCGQSAQFLTAYSYECQFFGNDSARADLSLVVWSGGSPPYTFEWSNGEVDIDSLFSVNEGLSNGAYTVTITDANGLVYMPQPAVVDCVPVAQDFTVGSSYECTFFPAEDSVSIDITTVVWTGPQPPYTFTWSTGEVTSDTMSSSVTVSVAGTYRVTITDAVGNTYVETVAITDCGPATGKIVIEEASALPGATVCVDVTAAQMQDLDALQMAIGWDPAHLALDMVHPGLASSGFILSDTATGLFRLDWNSNGTPLDIGAETPLFQLCFRVLAPVGQSVPLRFHTNLQTPEAYDSNGQPIPFDWRDGAVLVEPDSPDDAVQLVMESASVDPDSQVCLDITAANFTDIVSVQFSVRWDTAYLQFDSLIIGALPGLSPSTHFNLNNTGSGFLAFSWLPSSLSPASLADGERLFTLCFRASSAPGISTVAISSVPVPIEVTDGNAILPVSVTNGTVTTLGPQVWPGDTDTDENVNHFDLLNIGLAYGAGGPPRPNASTEWVQQPAPDWQQTTPLSGVNYKHIDTDGNGLIDASDTLAIARNWGLAPQGERGADNAPEANRQINTVLYIRPDTVVLGEPAVFDVIFGEASTPAEEVYGLAFTIVYDTAAVEPGSAFMTFDNSWIGQEPPGILTLSRDRYAHGRIDVALTRIDGQNVSGQGPIAQLHITIQDVIFLRGANYEMILNIENVRLINSAEEWIEAISQPSVVAIGDVSSSVEDAATKNQMKVFPVPASGQLFVYSPELPVQRLEVVSMEGRTLAVGQNTNELSVAELPAGPYLLRIWTEEGLSLRRIVVIR